MKTNDPPKQKEFTRDDLWEFFDQEHGLTLLDSQLNDIIHAVNRYCESNPEP